MKPCSMEEYEDRAVSLALNRPKLQALTDKLKSVRLTCPLFDTNRWVSSNYILYTLIFRFSMRLLNLKFYAENFIGEKSRQSIF